MKEFTHRFIYASAAFLIIFYMLAYAYVSFVPWIIGIAVLFLGMVGLWEYFFICQKKGIHISKFSFMFWGGALLISFLISPFISLSSFPILVSFLALLFFFALHFHHAKGAISHIGSLGLGLFYIVIPLGLAFWILYFPTITIDGRLWITYLIVVTKLTDIGGYFAGKLFGKKQLAATVSPGKTIEGAVLGFFIAILGSICFFLFVEHYYPHELHLSLIAAIILGAIFGVIGQIGDLSESLLKRDAEIKDSNKIPGIGGVLDMLDSLLFNIPVLYFYLTCTNL